MAVAAEPVEVVEEKIRLPKSNWLWNVLYYDLIIFVFFIIPSNLKASLELRWMNWKCSRIRYKWLWFIFTNHRPFDARFPNTNQTRACWQYYVDFNKCAWAKAEEGGAENAGCKKLQRLARIMCPGSWIEKWDSALEQGINPSDMNPPKWG